MVGTVADTTSCGTADNAVNEIENSHPLQVKENDHQLINSTKDKPSMMNEPYNCAYVYNYTVNIEVLMQ